MSDSIRLLVTGDLHIGRYPSRVPPDVDELEVAFVWESIATEAIDRKVDGLVLTGDIANAENQFFEAYGPLTRQLTRLAEAGIPTYAVAGNHDFEVLPKLADSLGSEKFRLLGRGSRWETVSLIRDDKPALHLTGWSFSRRESTKSALETKPEIPADGVPAIGLLHADLDQRESRYNPVSREELAEVPVSSWLLGHIHAASLDSFGTGILLYPGSPQPLDPGEKGTHGPWLVEILRDGTTTAEQIPLSTLSYVSAEIDISEANEEDTTPEAFLQTRIRRIVKEQVDSSKRVSYLSLRLRVHGMTSWFHKLPGVLIDLEDQWNETIDGIDLTIDRIENDTFPRLDLENIARGNDPPGILARLLLRQSSGDFEPADIELMERISRKADRIAASRAFSLVKKYPLESENELLVRTGWQLLVSMMNQKTTKLPHE